MAKVLILILLISFINLSMSYSGDERMKEVCGKKACSSVRLRIIPICGSDGKVYKYDYNRRCINRCLPPEEEVKEADPSLCEPEWTNIQQEARELGRIRFRLIQAKKN